jgi:hypothetical protein
VDKELEADGLGSSDVSSIHLPAQEELPCSPAACNDDCDANA